MISISKFIIFALTSSLVTAFPGSPSNGWKGADYGDNTTPAGGAMCMTSTYNIPTVISQPVTSIDTYTNSVTSTVTSYIPYTTESTITPGGVVTETQTITITTYAWGSTVVSNVVCETDYVTSSTSYETTVEQPTAIVSTYAPVVTDVIGTSTTVYQTYVPSLSYSTCITYNIITSNVPTSTLVCAGGESSGGQSGKPGNGWSSGSWGNGW